MSHKTKIHSGCRWPLPRQFLCLLLSAGAFGCWRYLAPALPTKLQFIGLETSASTTATYRSPKYSSQHVNCSISGPLLGSAGVTGDWLTSSFLSGLARGTQLRMSLFKWSMFSRAAPTSDYIEIWVMVKFWPADLEFGLWKNYFLYVCNKKIKKGTYIEIQNDFQNMFEFYDSLYGLWVKPLLKGRYWCSFWGHLPWKND